jgi:hypothetical protein
MVRWFIFDILKTPHFTLATILAITNYYQIINNYNYLLCFWSRILIKHPINIPKHVIGQKIHVKAWIFQCELGNFEKNGK